MKKVLLAVTWSAAAVYSTASTFANEFITGTWSNKLVVLAGEMTDKAQTDTGTLLSGPVGDYVIIGLIIITLAMGFKVFRK